MPITIADEVIGEISSEAALAAIREAIGSYAVRNAVREATEEALTEYMTKSAETAVQQVMEDDSLIPVIAAEMRSALVSGVGLALREGVVNMLVAMRGIPDYNREGQASAREEILAVMRGGA